MKTAKIQNHSVSSYYLIRQMVGALKFWHGYCRHFFARKKNKWNYTLEIISEKTHNTIVSVLYRPPNGHFEHFENFLTKFFLNKKGSNKNDYIAGDFNLNLWDHSLNKKVRNYLNLIYQNSFIPTVNKPTRFTRKMPTTIIICLNFICKYYF